MKLSDRILAITIVLIWGGNFVVVRWGIEDMHPITMTILRFLLTAVPMIFFIKRPSVPMKYIVMYGILFGSGVWGLVNVAISLGMTAGMASLLLQLSPFLTVLVAILIFHEIINVQRIIGIGIAFVGFVSICLVNPSNFSEMSLLLMFLSAVFWTICNVIIKVAQPKNAVTFTVWTSLFVPIPLFIMSMCYLKINELPFSSMLQLPSWKGWLSVGFQSIVATLFGYAGWAYLINKYGLSNIAIYSLIVPIAGLFCGWFFYKEQLSYIEIFGSVLVILGLLVVNMHQLILKKEN